MVQCKLLMPVEIFVGILYFVDKPHKVAWHSMVTPPEFDDIRPYNDAEVQPTLERLLHDNEFLDTASRFKSPSFSKALPRLMRPLVRQAIRKELDGITDVDGFQLLMKRYLQKVFDKTTTSLTVSGLESLEAARSYCFISNHRDIAMDPAVLNWVLYHNQFKTLRVAIGDNLLTKPFASDLMRLNKSFIVNRSATSPREKLKAAKKLSAYIRHSVSEENANVWLAQREGRAKDGMDKTNPAILSMLMLAKAKPQTLEDFLKTVPIVPVSISYEFDPCDEAKARELTVLQQTGEYTKGEQEDVQSIALGIRGLKGHVHLAFGQTLGLGIESVDQAVAYLDEAIWRNYVLHPTNCLAYELIESQPPAVEVGPARLGFLDWADGDLRHRFKQRVEACDPRWRDAMLQIYANPVYKKLELQAG